jgi:hypothetical protein
MRRDRRAHARTRNRTVSTELTPTTMTTVRGTLTALCRTSGQGSCGQSGAVGYFLHIPGESQGGILSREPPYYPTRPIVFRDLDPVLLLTRRHAKRLHADIQQRPNGGGSSTMTSVGKTMCDFVRPKSGSGSRSCRSYCDSSNDFRHTSRIGALRAVAPAVRSRDPRFRYSIWCLTAAPLC